MKILVVGDRDYSQVLLFLANNHELVFSQPENVLITMAMESPQAILCFAEKGVQSFTKAYTAYTDLKRSMSHEVKLVRLGFLPKDPIDDEVYVRLPFLPDELTALL